MEVMGNSSNVNLSWIVCFSTVTNYDKKVISLIGQ